MQVPGGKLCRLYCIIPAEELEANPLIWIATPECDPVLGWWHLARAVANPTFILYN